MEKEYQNEVYKECLRNHAASLGSYATDGCGEFTLDDTTSSPSTLQCAACGCHRNFHRKLSYCRSSSRDPENTVELIDYDGGGGGISGGSGSAGGGGGAPRRMVVAAAVESTEGKGRKRFRSKFTAEQKEKMLGFAEKLGWRLQRRDEEDEVEKFCRGIGVSRQVFKVWMHNHKNNSSSPSSASASTCNNNASSSLTTQ